MAAMKLRVATAWVSTATAKAAMTGTSGPTV
jgi:hypothetical protein